MNQNGERLLLDTIFLAFVNEVFLNNYSVISQRVQKLCCKSLQIFLNFQKEENSSFENLQYFTIVQW